MKVLKIATLSLMAIGLVVFLACTPATVTKGDTGKGKLVFNDVNFGAGTSGKSCNSCHPDGKGLEKSGDKKEFAIMGQNQNSLEEAVNVCIEMALKGKSIDTKSDDMVNIVAYIKSLK
jgi:cytochrome c5